MLYKSYHKRHIICCKQNLNLYAQEKTYPAKGEFQQSRFQLVHGTFVRSHALCRTDYVSHYHGIPLNRTSPFQSKLYSVWGFVKFKPMRSTGNHPSSDDPEKNDRSSANPISKALSWSSYKLTEPIILIFRNRRL